MTKKTQSERTEKPMSNIQNGGRNMTHAGLWTQTEEYFCNY